MSKLENMKEHALHYAKIGFAVFPLKYKDKKPITENGCKDATTDREQIEKWWKQYPYANIGIATGTKSNGLMVIDLDIDENTGINGYETLHRWEIIHGKLPDTWQSITGRGGYHLFYQVSQPISNKVGLLEGIDIRGEGGYIVAPPSIHPNGRRYEWESGTEEYGIVKANEIVFELLNYREPKTESFHMPEQIPEGQRTSYLVKMLCSMQAKGASDQSIQVAVAAENDIKCNPPLTEKELEKEVFPALRRYQKGTSPYSLNNKPSISPVSSKINLSTVLIDLKPEFHYSWDDKGNGKLFADIFKDKCRYNVTAKEWYVYNGKNWEEDTGGMIVSSLAKKLSIELYSYSFGLEDEKRASEYRKHLAKLGQLKYRETMIKDARDSYFIKADDLDKDAYLFNCQNGTINLKTFEFYPHKSSDMLSKISNVEYEPNAKSLDFEKFINEVLQGQAEKIEYMQKLFGYALSGDTSEEAAYLLYGPTTRNGKGTLLETYAHMLGGSDGYAMTINPESLAQKKIKDSRQASGDIARLKGCRFLNMSEPPEGMIFDAALLKTLLGRDTITARHLQQREFEFKPYFKLFINTNHLPRVIDDSLFTSGRLNVVTFDRHFEPEEQDKHLKDRLKRKENISGIFNWCLEGLKKFYETGAKPPTQVAAATNQYQKDSDKIGLFITDCLEKSKRNTKGSDIYSKYQSWCRESGQCAEGKSRFFRSLKDRGMLSDLGTVNGVTCKNVVIGYEIQFEVTTEEWN